MKNHLSVLKITIAAALLLEVSSPNALAQHASQKLDSLIISYASGDGEPMTHGSKNLFTYDADRNNIRSIYFEYDPDGGWITDSRIEHTYDDQHRVISDTHEQWDPEMNQWTMGWKHVTTYDPVGKITLKTDYSREEGSSEWITVAKEEFTYTASGDIKQITSYNFEGGTGQWVIVHKSVNTYNQPSVLFTTTGYLWDNGLSQWIPNHKEEYAYHVNGKVAGQTYFSWNSSLKEWMYLNRAEFTFDESGNQLVKYYSVSEDGTDQWIPSSKNEAAYDDNANMNESKYYYWDKVRSAWALSYKDTYLWDLTLNRSEIMLPAYFPTENFNSRLTGMIFHAWNPDSGSWSYQGQGFLYYSEASASGVPDIRMPRARIFPNPATDHLQVESPGNHLPYIVELYDNQGRLAIRKELTGNEQISLENLAAGPYLYKILLNGQTQVGKIIKN
jgi:hypothetical protein